MKHSENNQSCWVRFWMVLFALSVLGSIDCFDSDIIDLPRLIRYGLNGLVSIFKATVLTAGLFYSRKYQILRIAALSVTVVYALLCLVNGFCWLMYDMGITVKLFTVLSQTTYAETSEFIPQLLEDLWRILKLPSVIIIFVMMGVAFWVVGYIPCKKFVCFSHVGGSLGLVSLIIILCSLSVGRVSFSVFGRTIKSSVQAYQEALNVKRMISCDRPLPYADSIASRELCDVIIILGESASRSHHSLYGYVLETTPLLDEKSDSLIVFTDVIGSSTTTAFNMNRILTFVSDHDDAAGWSSSPSLFDVMSHAGYKTAWLSNQERSGTWSNNVLAMVRNADVVEYLGNMSSDDATIRAYDEILIPSFSKFLSSKDGPKFVGVHLFGSHIQYRKRYPSQYAYFNADSVCTAISRPLSGKQAKLIAEYDNSIRYTDYVLNEIIKISSKSQRPQVVIYFSDHGENVYDDGDFNGRDRKSVEVPFIVYLNRPFRLVYPDVTERLVDARNLPVSTANIIHPVLSLTGTTYNLYSDSLDFLSSYYKIKPRFVDDRKWEYEQR